MLKSPKQTALKQVAPRPEDIFVEHYEQLRVWALHFSKGDKSLAEDLLHDAFMQVTVNQIDFSTIANLEAYLYVVMRNLHISQIRRATRNPIRPLSIVEFDTANVGFWASDPRDRIRLREELFAVCDYACLRKESAKAGSVLILRFFHGYYPEEISQIMRVTPLAVKERLRLARAEARLYVEDPDRLGFISKKPVHRKKQSSDSLSDDLRLELRKVIFDARIGECFLSEELHRAYKDSGGEWPNTPAVAHIVSCYECLENVNSELGLPPLASRYPVDMIGNDPGKRGGGGDGSGGAGGGSAGGSKMLDRYVSRRDEMVRHEPGELRISVNGYIQGSHKVAADKNEMTLVIDAAEQLGFVEIFSEQGVRLLMLNVEPLPDGETRQAMRALLSDGRTLDANLSFGGTSPVLQVIYLDPSLAPDGSTAIELTEAPDAGLKAPLLTRAGRWTPSFDRRGGSLFSLRSWFQPARLTAAFAALLIATLLILKFVPFGTPTAGDLLARSIEAENARLADKDRVLHRTLDFDELSADGQLISRKKIDIYQSGKGITARRLYDERGVLAAGDWRQKNGVQTIYHRGAPAKLQPLPEKRSTILTFDDAWQISASAQDFKGLIASLDVTQVETRASSYVVSYSTNDVDIQAGIIRAAITLSRDDLHATEQSFMLRQNSETREYRITETGYDWKPANTVAPAVFEPNIELIGVQSSPPARGRVADVSSDGVVGVSPENTNTAPSAAIATPALEVEVVDALNNAGAFMGEQINIYRTADGKVSVTAMVETPDRKRALLSALANFKSNPAVRIRIETVSEVQARTKPGKQNSTQQITVDNIQMTEDDSLVFAELKKKFSDDEARRFADSIVSRARQARTHALAAKQLAEHFSESDLASLSPAEHARWVAAIRGHAEAFIQQTQALQRDLQQFFPEAGVGVGTGGDAISSDRELQTRARELFQAAMTIENGLGSSFAISAARGSSPQVKSAAFWRSFAGAVGIAKSLAAAR